MNTKGKQSGKKVFSLRFSIIVLILGCWVFPILLISGVSGYYTSHLLYQRIAGVTSGALQNSMDIVRRDIENIVDTSFNASYLPTIRQAYTRFLQDGDEVAFYNEIKGFLNQDYGRNRHARAAFLLFPEIDGKANDLYSAYNSSLATPADTVYYNRFYQSEAAQKAAEFSDTIGTDVAFFESEGRLFLVRNLSIIGNQYRNYAILVVEVNQQALFANLQTLPWMTGLTVVLNNTVLPVGETQMAEFSVSPAQGESGSRMEGDMLELWGDASSERFTLGYYGVADLKPMLAESGAARYIVVALALLAIPLMAGVLFFFYRKVSRPIGELSNLSHMIEEGEFGVQLEADELGSSEFNYLGRHFNAMSARLEYQFERIYREELALRDAKIKALQSQINPHFLGNTLEIINWEARLAGNVKISMMLEALSTMLEAALDRGHRPLIRLSEEMMYVNAYLYIIGQRLGKRLQVEKELDEEVLEWMVPRLILQPIIENAVEHGVAAHQKGSIKIRARRIDDSWMVLEVENDAPMGEEDQKKVERLLSGESDPSGESSANIGIRNVDQRLRMIFGPKSGLSIQSDGISKTVSSIRIGKKQ